MNKEMYFIRVIPTNMPKNNLHKQIDKEIARFNHTIIHDVEVFADNIKCLITNLNELHPRCGSATVSHTRPLKDDENATHLIYISCKVWYINIHLTFVRGGWIHYIKNDQERLSTFENDIRSKNDRLGEFLLNNGFEYYSHAYHRREGFVNVELREDYFRVRAGDDPITGLDYIYYYSLADSVYELSGFLCYHGYIDKVNTLEE